MDWMTPLGYLIGFGSVGFVLVQGNSVGLILNVHAILLVFGGTLGATLLSYPASVIFQADARRARVSLSRIAAGHHRGRAHDCPARR